MRISDWSSDVCSSDLETLDGHGNHHEFVVAHSGCGHDVGDARPALRERPGLVEGKRGQRAEIFEWPAALDEDAAARGARNPRKNGARGRDGERTGARGDQYGHCAIKAVAEGLIDHDPAEEPDKD